MKILESLIMARAFIEEPENWTRGFCARDESGAWTLPDSATACCWCALGACLAIDDPSLLIFSPTGPLFAVLPKGETLLSFNDDERNTHADILNLFDRAIAKLLV